MRWSFATIVLVPRAGSFEPPTSTGRREVFAWAKAAGFSGIELADAWLDFTRLGERSLLGLRTEIADAGLRVSGVNLPRCLFTREPSAESEFARAERGVRAAALLEAEVVNLSLSLPLASETGAARPVLSGHQVNRAEYQSAADLVARIARTAHAAGAKLALELHDDGLLDTPELCLQMLAYFDQPNIGLNPDVANLCRGPGPVADWRRAFELLAPHAINWHVKNYRHGQPAPIAGGDIDYAVAWGIMRAAGYNGWVSIESRFGDVLAEQRAGLAYLNSLAHAEAKPLLR